MMLHGNPFDFLIVLAAGVVVSFTPCVYPLLPVTMSSVAGANASGSRLAGFFLSVLYVLGMALTYSFLAVIAALSGRVFGTLQNSFGVMLVIASLILVFALAMLDVLRFPTISLQPNALRTTRRPHGKFSVFLMGMASGFIVGPCTAPVLGTLLVFVASRQNIALGVSLLFVFALGLGFSLIMAGTFSGFIASMPRSGVWMERVKKIAGLGLLLLAGYYFWRAFQLM